MSKMSDNGDPRLVGLAERTIRSTRLMRAIGFDALELALAVAFHDATRPWTARALSDYICHPRTNVLKRLREHSGNGIFSKTPQGWIVCAEAQEIYCRFLSDFLDLLAGERVGFSTDVVAYFETAMSDPRRPSRRQMDAALARSITFPKQPLIFRHVREET
ncbi:MAG: hypothetical protein CML66_25280 [Rhodobacteraceae bacterium]|nr:hypothetical protein [Paracoccaceae bacterium]MAY47104.1 hypothetical protein [Paracoccaceae bacterium]QEW19910.1 hypothetical protein LA6_002101 [Marinibacterium anthonyi]